MQGLFVPDVSVLHNVRVKLFPHGYVEVLGCNCSIFHGSGWEPAGKWENAPNSDVGKCLCDTQLEFPLDSGMIPDRHGSAIRRSIRRAKSRIHEICMANRFDMFVTLTLDKDKIDRYDPAVVVRKMGQWADNQVRRHGLKYCLVPELHKDGAVHFHGFLQWPDGGGFVDSGTIRLPGKKNKKPRRPRTAAQREAWLADGGQIVYNIPAWPYGFSTAIALYGDYGAAVGYVGKYVGKGMDIESDGDAVERDTPLGGKIGGRWYYSGGALVEPEKLLMDVALDDLREIPGAYEFVVDDARRDFVLWRGMADALPEWLRDKVHHDTPAELQAL